MLYREFYIVFKFKDIKSRKHAGKAYLLNFCRRFKVIRIVLVILIILLFSCEKSSTGFNPDDGPVSLKLKADKTEGSAPLNIKFTATLYGNLDSLQLCKECTFSFCEGSSHTCISYCSSCDSAIAPQKEYHYQYTYTNSGTYRPYMWLNLYNSNAIMYSDTLTIIVK